MAPLTGPVLVACALLVLGGAPKIARPVATVGALRSVGLRTPAAGVRALGAAEAALGVLAATVGGPVLVGLVAASYAGFTAFLVVALRRGGALASCGCLGRPDTPPTRSHAAVTAALAGLSAAAAAGGADPGWAGMPAVDAAVTLAFAALATWLAWLAFTVLPHARFPIQPREH